MAKNEPVTSSGTYNVLAGATVIKGNIFAEEDCRLDGTVEGNITCKGKIIIGQQSNITGEINCANIDILGKINGNIICSNAVILRASANLTGEIKTKTIEIEPGAKFYGTCSMAADENKYTTNDPE